MSKVLIVDDNSDILWVVETVLKRYGFEVLALPKGEDVLPKTKLFAPDLILLDVFLSGIDGIEVCNKLLKKLGLKAVVIRREGGRGEQVRIWAVDNLFNPTRIKLLKAAIERMGGDSSQVIERPPDEPDKSLSTVLSDGYDSSSGIVEDDELDDELYESEFLEDPDEGDDP